jgi:hypothetical protein
MKGLIVCIIHRNTLRVNKSRKVKREMHKTISLVNPEVKRPCGIPRCRLEDRARGECNVKNKTNFQKIFSSFCGEGQ